MVRISPMIVSLVMMVILSFLRFGTPAAKDGQVSFHMELVYPIPHLFSMEKSKKC